MGCLVPHDNLRQGEMGEDKKSCQGDRVYGIIEGSSRKKERCATIKRI
ncbi:MAG: hypothetical protein NZ901_12085 [Geminocystis sp.]|nr:hypothetical protein [Geminocystis sp.]HIK37507.1 hypothetical protein [Geminocystis sp. M7585_C2015_104]MCS7148908.1 hypothetical protein [Geminocystis sp.]MCX8077463.1 hypothetical protein [Geminocystis sp.]MDW8116993.1 hypothetical protein [Geminocystis sp.]